MSETERRLVQEIGRLCGTTPALEESPLDLLDSLGMQRLLAHWGSEIPSPALDDLRSIAALARFLDGDAGRQA
ncbi:MAG: hypothetical protein JO101_11195 [Candidatus Eremiobacteraeota bacterium]|nr:hypothetical protein [Candidatus Eremiobacteraeota bacterium]MBV8355878.1 hypothetical protein [Candidatus Eremiobacteraeota bacterium]